MEMRRVFRGIARSTHIPQNISLADRLTLPQPVGITLEVSVIVPVSSRWGRTDRPLSRPPCCRRAAQSCRPSTARTGVCLGARMSIASCVAIRLATRRTGASACPGRRPRREHKIGGPSAPPNWTVPDRSPIAPLPEAGSRSFVRSSRLADRRADRPAGSSTDRVSVSVIACPWKRDEVELRQDDEDEQCAAQEPAPRARCERAEVALPVAVRPRSSCRHSSKTTRVPGLTSRASRSASQFVNRTQPCDSVRPIVDGSGEPCSP